MKIVQSFEKESNNFEWKQFFFAGCCCCYVKYIHKENNTHRKRIQKYQDKFLVRFCILILFQSTFRILFFQSICLWHKIFQRRIIVQAEKQETKLNENLKKKIENTTTNLMNKAIFELTNCFNLLNKWIINSFFVCLYSVFGIFVLVRECVRVCSLDFLKFLYDIECKFLAGNLQIQRAWSNFFFKQKNQIVNSKDSRRQTGNIKANKNPNTKTQKNNQNTRLIHIKIFELTEIIQSTGRF